MRAWHTALGAIAVALGACAPDALGQGQTRAELAPAARAALQSTALTDSERAELRLRHGTWDEADLTTPSQRARAALALWELGSPALADAAAPLDMRAAALIRSGQPADALALLTAATTPAELLRRAEALEDLGRRPEAAESARSAQAAAARPGATRDDRMDAVEATALLARVEGTPARDWQRMLDELAALREADRLDPRPRLLEGRLLVEKDRFQDGVKALGESLSLDIRSSEALYLLGRVSLMTYDFDGARTAARELRGLSAAHPLAALLEGEIALQARVPDDAAAALDTLLAVHPQHREALALRAAADAMRFDDAGVELRLAEFEKLVPGSPVAYYQVGRFLSMMRQYEQASVALNEAARRAPAWSTPVAELGLLEMQSGRDTQALAALTRAVELDPFDERARFSRTLMEMLAQWPRLEGEHFIVRFKPGADEVVAAMMPQALDAMHSQVTDWLGYQPAQKTVIELHPDHKSFAVRITGMPWIHTIAASTGPLIALEVPKEGAPEKHLGRFDWLEVLRHEYVHTVTLEQTHNRISHWFTEALATRLETKPRTFETAQLLAAAFTSNTLFDLTDINWAFVRPKKPSDRQQAYAQGRWMVEFMEERFGRPKVLELLAAYRDGIPESEAMRRVLGVTGAEFMSQFHAYAEKDLQAWGMLPEPSLTQLVDALRVERSKPTGAMEIDDATLAQWLTKHPTHPDLLEMWLRRRLKDEHVPTAEETERLAAYAKARPVDSWPHRVLAKAAIDAGDADQAVPHLERLDALEDSNPVYALELARMERKRGNARAAVYHAEKAVRIDPYDPHVRELVAALAVEAGDLKLARVHILALVTLEPAVERHRQRLDRIDAMLREQTQPAK